MCRNPYEKLETIKVRTLLNEPKDICFLNFSTSFLNLILHFYYFSSSEKIEEVRFALILNDDLSFAFFHHLLV